MKNRSKHLKWLLLLPLSFGPACSLWEDDAVNEAVDDEDEESKSAKEDQAKAKAKKKSEAQLNDERELKLARLWSRVDELEENQRKFKEKLKLLERGLMLGIMPDELTEPSPTYEKLPASPKSSPEATKSLKPSVSLTSPLTPQEEKAYQDALAAAHEHFRAGRYGRAIVDFDNLGKRWGNRVQGAAYLYWIGKSWIQLKEYYTAKKVLEEFLTSHAKSAWVPRAKLELARIDWKLGHNETALGKYREIIRDYPYEDAAEMAKMELSQVDKAL